VTLSFELAKIRSMPEPADTVSGLPSL
jgi:hypothetical protein